jgi:hypothetical protein
MTLTEIISRILTVSASLVTGDCIPSHYADDQQSKTKADLLAELQNADARLNHMGQLLAECYHALMQMRETSLVKLYQATDQVLDGFKVDESNGHYVLDAGNIQAIVAESASRTGLIQVGRQITAENDLVQVIKEAAGFWDIHNPDEFAKSMVQALKSKYPYWLTISFD